MHEFEIFSLAPTVGVAFIFILCHQIMGFSIAKHPRQDLGVTGLEGDPDCQPRTGWIWVRENQEPPSPSELHSAQSPASGTI